MEVMSCEFENVCCMKPIKRTFRLLLLMYSFNQINLISVLFGKCILMSEDKDLSFCSRKNEHAQT